MVLAVGGGSAIDCAKGVGAAAKTADGDVWPLVAGGAWVTDALPVAVVLTNAATGSEMDAWSVISNMDVNQKIGLGGSALIPRVAFENPEHSYTLPAYQTACGAFDIFNHVLDNYYLAGDATFDLVLEMQEAVMRTVVKWTPVALEEPQNYEARANLMWASSMALNTVLDAGTVHGCACHMMEHELSAYYDITHGHGLAILAPRWLEYVLDDGTASAIYRLGIAVFGVEEGLSPEEGARRAIERVSSFAFETLGLEGTLTELGIDEAHFQDMARHACGGGRIPGLRSLGAKLGKLVYVMDAALDMEDDRASGSYNPLVALDAQPQEVREDLELLAADAAAAFERLPLERDARVLRSVLYAGVWQKYCAKEAKRTKQAKETKHVQEEHQEAHRG